MNDENLNTKLKHFTRMYKESIKKDISDPKTANLNTIVSYAARRAIKNLLAIKAYYFLSGRSRDREAKKNNIV